MNKTTQAALAFIAQADKYGFAITTRDSVVTIAKSFTPGDLAAFSSCDSLGPLLLGMVPLKGGSVWGTDGGSVGGYSAVKNGCYTLNKSGQSGKRFVATLQTELTARGVVGR